VETEASGGGSIGPAALPYRPCVGVVLANADGRVLIAERLDMPGAWQMPQGGIDPDESPREACYRELEEEIGVGPALADVTAEYPDWLTYDLPDDLVGKVWKGRWRGQKQRWFLLRFRGRDADILLETSHPEFSRWRWVQPDEAVSGIVPFKRDIYRAVLSYFGPFLGGQAPETRAGAEGGPESR